MSNNHYFFVNLKSNGCREGNVSKFGSLLSILVKRIVQRAVRVITCYSKSKRGEITKLSCNYNFTICLYSQATGESGRSKIGARNSITTKGIIKFAIWSIAG